MSHNEFYSLSPSEQQRVVVMEWQLADRVCTDMDTLSQPLALDAWERYIATLNRMSLSELLLEHWKVTGGGHV